MQGLFDDTPPQTQFRTQPGRLETQAFPSHAPMPAFRKHEQGVPALEQFQTRSVPKHIAPPPTASQTFLDTPDEFARFLTPLPESKPTSGAPISFPQSKVSGAIMGGGGTKRPAPATGANPFSGMFEGREEEKAIGAISSSSPGWMKIEEKSEAPRYAPPAQSKAGGGEIRSLFDEEGEGGESGFFSMGGAMDVFGGRTQWPQNR